MQVNKKPLNIRLNDLRKDMGNPKAVPACVYFRNEGHKFMQHAKFTLREQSTETKKAS